MNSRYEVSINRRERIARFGLGAATLWVSVLAVWFVTRPYLGIDGDARFYAVEGLAKLSPAAFAGDLFLAGGNNAPGSIYLLLYTPLLARLGLQASNLLLVLIGGALWSGGAYSLAANLFRPSALVIWGFVLTLALPSNLGFIAAGEPIVTPRLFAEGLSLYAIAFAVGGRSLPAVAFLAIAFLLHPLMTLPAIALLVVYLGYQRPEVFAWALLPAAVVLTLVVVNVWPFSLGRQTFDQAWLGELRIREYSVFLENWTTMAWLPVLDTVLLTPICLIVAQPEQRRLIWSALTVSVAGFTIAFIGGDLLHNELIFDLQLWRSGWVLIIVTHILTAQVVCAASTRVSIKVKYLIALAVALWILSRFVSPLLLLSVATMAVAGGALTVGRLAKCQMKAIALAAIYAYTLFLAYCGFLVLRIWFAQMHNLSDDVRRCLFDIALLVSAITIIVIVQEFTPKGRMRSITSVTQLSAALIILAFSAAQWDHRSKWSRFLDRASAAPTSLSEILPAGPIYFEGDVRVPWFLLRRASYFSCDQGAAILFSRKATMLFAERFGSFSVLHSLDYQQGPFCPTELTNVSERSTVDPLPQEPGNKKGRAFEVAAICTREPELGAIVLTKPLAEDPSAVWESPVPFEFVKSRSPVIETSETSTFYVYDCKREANNQ